MVRLWLACGSFVKYVAHVAHVAHFEPHFHDFQVSLSKFHKRSGARAVWTGDVMLLKIDICFKKPSYFCNLLGYFVLLMSFLICLQNICTKYAILCTTLCTTLSKLCTTCTTCTTKCGTSWAVQVPFPNCQSDFGWCNQHLHAKYQYRCAVSKRSFPENLSLSWPFLTLKPYLRRELEI